MTNPVQNQAARAVASAFAEALAGVFTGELGELWKIAVLDSQAAETERGQLVHVRIAVDGGVRGDLFIELDERYARAIVSKYLGEPAEVFSREQRDAFERLLQGATGKVAETLAAEYGRLTFKIGYAEGLSFGGMFMVRLKATTESLDEVPILLYFDNAFTSGPLLQEPARQYSERVPSPSLDAANLKLVMDVELNVTLRFGQRQLPLREVLELTSGSVVELDRQVDEPVELLLDGKVIARGEAVIVDGNYGLRVTEIPQPIAAHFGR
jgi:flagellar motor switch protein FliN/FliY